MPRRILTLSVALTLAAAAIAAGEEYMPMRGGAVSETGAGVTAAPLRRTSSADSQEESVAPPVRKTVVRITLPSLGAKPEARPRLVDAGDSGPDGRLNFDASRNAGSASASAQADIPGLIPPEVLAMDKYDLSDPAPPRLRGELAFFSDNPGEHPAARKAAPDQEKEYAEPEPPQGRRFEELAGDLVGPQGSNLRRLDSLEREKRSVAFARIELPPPVPAAPAPPSAALDAQAMFVSLPPPIAPPSSPNATLTRRSPLAPPSQQPDRRSLRPPTPEAPSAPELSDIESRNALAVPAVFTPLAPPPLPEVSAQPIRTPELPILEPAGPPAAMTEPKSRITPMRELKSVLSPIYRNSGR